jgi:hypothetical protein
MDHVVMNRVTSAQAVVPQVMAAMMAQMVVVMVDGVMPGSREG